MFLLCKLLIIILIIASCTSEINCKPSHNEQNYNIWAPSYDTFKNHKDELYSGYFALLIKQNDTYILKQLSNSRVQKTLPNEEILYFDTKLNRIYPAFEKAAILKKGNIEHFDTYCCFDILIDPSAVNNFEFFDFISPMPYEACSSKFTEPSAIPTYYKIDKDEIKSAIEQSGVIDKIRSDTK